MKKSNKKMSEEDIMEVFFTVILCISMFCFGAMTECIWSSKLFIYASISIILFIISMVIGYKTSKLKREIFKKEIHQTKGDN